MSPKVSVIIANLNGRRFVEAALKSVFSQSLQDIEIIVVDNCSTDGCYELVKQLAMTEPRLRVFQTKFNSGGPSVPRNLGIEEARGEWIAIMDNDDMMHPDRLLTLVTKAEADGADIVADDLSIFNDGSDETTRYFTDLTEFWVDPVSYVRSNVFYGNELGLGYLKPLIRSTWLKATRYHAGMHLAEDYDLIIRLLIRGARMKVYPAYLMYYYRKHTDSISYRLTKQKLIPPLHFSGEMIHENRNASPELLDALRVRHESIQMAIAFDDLVTAIKHKQMSKAVAIGYRHPGAAGLLRLPILKRWRKLLGTQMVLSMAVAVPSL